MALQDREAIRGILLDSGDTLVRPISGAWFPGRHFHRMMREYGFTNYSADQLERAMTEAGKKTIDPHALIRTEEEEFAFLTAYYDALVRNLGHTPSDDHLVRALARGNLDDAQIEPFPEVRGVLERLRARGFRLAVVSNAWPSLERRYRGLGFRHFFDSFIISTQVGTTKPDPAIFRHAIEGLGLAPASLLFVDDWPGYVRAAIQLGMRGVAIIRGDQVPPSDVPWISDLGQVEALVG